jgi:L-malate glycosyltransferase
VLRPQWNWRDPRPQAPPVQPRSLRLALLMSMQMRKFGSGESWILALCREARRRGHAMDIFSLPPILPSLAQELKGLGVGLENLEDIARHPVRGRQRLARYDVLQMHFIGLRSRLGLIACAAWPARLLCVDNSSGRAEASQGLLERVRRGGSRQLDLLSRRRLGGIVAVSNYVAERNRQRFDLGPDKVRTLWYGVDMERFRPGPRREPGRRLALLTVAHLIPEKGVDVLLRALALMRDKQVELRVVGDGPEASRLARLAESLGLGSRVEFLGLRNDVEQLLAQADVFVHPAVWQEAFGMTIAEAMTCGRPVVASRVGAVPELIEHERSGLLFPAGSAQALAQALDRLAEDAELCERLGQQARARAESLFELHTSVRHHLDWFEELARSRGRAYPATRPG